jgi:hypothetical protein
MSWVWISGKLTGKQMAEEYPAELEAMLRVEGPGDIRSRGDVRESPTSD